MVTYHCSKCGSPNHNKQRCGKTGRTPVIPAQYLPGGHSLPGSLSPPSSAPVTTYDEMYKQYAAKDSHAGSKSAGIPEPDGISGELRSTARFVMRKLGVEGEQAESVLASVASKAQAQGDYRFVSGDEAAATVASLIPESDTPDEIVEAIRSEQVLLTRSEIATLVGVRDEVLARQDVGFLISAGEPDAWVPHVEQRRCTICGQFVGVLKSHECDSHKAKELVANLVKQQGEKKRTVTISVLAEDGKSTQELKSTIVLMKDGDEVPLDYLQDLYLANEEDPARRRWSAERYQFLGESSEAYRAQIIMGFYKKRMFGEDRLMLPPQLRAAYLESPVNGPLEPLLVAETIEPPLEKHEVQRLIENLGDRPQAVSNLLLSPRVRDSAVYVLENKPTQAGEALAKSGALPTDILSGMASCGDQMVRRQAATAPNLDEASMRALATDPDSDVRGALLFGAAPEDTRYSADTTPEQRLYEQYKENPPGAGYVAPGTMWESAVTRNPHLLNDYVNDPDERLALSALAAFPYSRHALRALGQVRSRQRLETIASRLDEIWPYYSPAPEPPDDTSPEFREIGRIQGLLGEDGEKFMVRARGKLARRHMRVLLYQRTGINEAKAEPLLVQARDLIAQRLS